jgi:hypothetical protein
VREAVKNDFLDQVAQGTALIVLILVPKGLIAAVTTNNLKTEPYYFPLICLRRALIPQPSTPALNRSTENRNDENEQGNLNSKKGTLKISFKVLKNHP